VLSSQVLVNFLGMSQAELINSDGNSVLPSVHDARRDAGQRCRSVEQPAATS